MQEQTEIPFGYVYDRVLAGSEEVRGDSVAIDTDGDFELRALAIQATNTNFSLQVRNAAGIELFSAYIRGENLGGLGPMPYVFMYGVHYPAGGRISLDIRDNSAAPNTVQLEFRGIKRLRSAEWCGERR